MEPYAKIWHRAALNGIGGKEKHASNTLKGERVRERPDVRMGSPHTEVQGLDGLDSGPVDVALSVSIGTELAERDFDVEVLTRVCLVETVWVSVVLLHHVLDGL